MKYVAVAGNARIHGDDGDSSPRMLSHSGHISVINICLMPSTILVVEDDLAIAELVALHCKHAGYAVKVANTAPAAERFLRTRHYACREKTPCGQAQTVAQFFTPPLS